jgi:hypothetical protein
MSRTWSKCLPIRLWPSADQAAWEAAIHPNDPFESEGIAMCWSLATKRKTAAGYGRYLCWLGERGELDETADPTARITRERLAAYLDELRRTNRGHTIQTRIQELGDAMRALAPNGDWRFIKRAAGRLRANTIPARDKRGRLPPIVDPIAQGYRMMEEAEKVGILSDSGVPPSTATASSSSSSPIICYGYAIWHRFALVNICSFWRIGSSLRSKHPRPRCENVSNKNCHHAYLWQ